MYILCEVIHILIKNMVKIQEEVMIVNKQKFDARLKELDLTRGMLAQMTGIHRCTLSNILNGKTKPSYEVMNVIYYVLALSPQEAADIFFNNKSMMSRHTINCYEKFFLKNQGITVLDLSKEEYIQQLVKKSFY